MILILLLITGCQGDKNSKNNIEEVVNEHGNISNLYGLDTFVEKVNNQTKAEINVVSYGIEGQRLVETLSYNGDDIGVSRSVDEEFVEKYQCEDIVVEKVNQNKDYILKQCTGNFEGDTVILSTSKGN